MLRPYHGLPRLRSGRQAPGRFQARIPQPAQGFQGGLHRVDGIAGTQGLADHIPHAAQFQDGPHRAGGDNARPFRSRLNHHNGRPHLDGDFVGNGAALDGNFHQFPAGDGVAFPHRVGDDQGFAHSRAHVAHAVAHHHQGIKAQPAAALYHLGDAAGIDHPLGKTAGILGFPGRTLGPGGPVCRTNH